jgi:chromate transport protein ChrA
MADMWNDLKLALTLILFVYLVTYLSGLTGSKKLGIIMAAIVAYLTFFTHWEMLVLILVIFFAYPFFIGLADAIAGD